MKSYSTITRRGVLAKMTKGKCRFGFTLIELLATLSIMALIATALIPFIGDYTAKARNDTNFRSLKVLQDAIDRNLALDTAGKGTNWGTAPSGTNREVVTGVAVTNILNDIMGVNKPEYRTMREAAPSLTGDNIMIVIDSATNTTWEVVKFRKKSTEPGVDLAGNEVSTANWTNTTDAILRITGS